MGKAPVMLFTMGLSEVAMKVKVLGCGEAFDPKLPNTSLLVDVAGKRLLLDCGYNIPQRVWESVPEQDGIDLIYISHAHADHYFGLPALLTRMKQGKREKPLVLITQPEVQQRIRQVADHGYRESIEKLPFELRFVDAREGSPVEWSGLQFTFAPTIHPFDNLAIRIEAEGTSFVYSGDGLPTEPSTRLCRDTRLVVHEAFHFDPFPGHGDIEGVLRLADEEGVGAMALVHILRDLRAEPQRILDRLAGTPHRMPEPGDVMEVA
jgi:ribonuclease Z